MLCYSVGAAQVLEAYMIQESDVAKDSSSQIMTLCRVLDLAEAVLKRRGLSVPEHLILQAWVFQTSATAT